MLMMKEVGVVTMTIEECFASMWSSWVTTHHVTRSPASLALAVTGHTPPYDCYGKGTTLDSTTWVWTLSSSTLDLIAHTLESPLYPYTLTLLFWSLYIGAVGGQTRVSLHALHFRRSCGALCGESAQLGDSWIAGI